MIGYLSGKVKFLFEDSCILDVHGVGYKIFLDAQSRQTLTPDAAAEFFIHTAVSDNAITLYGMKERATFVLFELLLTVSGIGAKSALAIVSKIAYDDFANAVAAQDLKTLTKLPGVGKKSAERILLELKDKVKSTATPPQAAQIQSSTQDEAAEALEALGYTASELANVFKSAPPNATVEQLVKFALKELNRLGR